MKAEGEKMVKWELFLKAVEKFETPLYFYDFEIVKERIIKTEKALENVEHKIFFAFKANSNLHILKFMRSMGLGADVVSFNEYKMAKQAGFLPSEIIVNGNGKKIDELKLYSEENVACVNVDSKEEIEKLRGDLHLKVALRINPNVDAKTHPHISTGLRKNKFGIDLESVKDVVRNFPSNLELAGLHCHIGSQITDVSPFVEAISSLKDFMESQHLNLKFINIGGGWGIDYLKDGNEMDMEKYKAKVIPLLKSFRIPVYLELGRYILAPAGFLIMRVTEVKRTPFKNFIVVDTSMADLLRPSLYNAYHHVEFFSKGEEITADIVGRACESGDMLALQRKVATPKVGDIGVIHDVGAYGYSMSSNYNLSLRPAEVAFDGKKIKLIRRREDFEDLTRLF
jgi:diaminopimelate decarboxylase